MKKKIKKIWLLLLAEIYLLLKNTWGMITHPYKTLREIRFTKDFSQALLVLGLPFYLWLFLVFLFFLIRLFSLFVVKIPGPFGLFGFAIFLVLSVVLLLAEIYIFFWLFYYLKVRKRARREIETRD